MKLNACRNQLDALDKFTLIGVEGTELVGWSDALDKCGCTLKIFREEIKKLGSLKAFVSAKEAELSAKLNSLKTEENMLISRVKTLNTLNEQLQSENHTLISDYTKNVRDSLSSLIVAADNASEATKRLNSVIDDPATGLKARSTKVNTLITDAAVEAKKTILSAADEVEKAMNDSYEAGKLVAQYRHSDLMLPVILNEPVDKTTGLFALSTAMRGAYMLESHAVGLSIGVQLFGHKAGDEKEK